jgi:transposase-like protein
MKPVSELKQKMGSSKPVDGQSHKQVDAEPASEPTSLLSSLEAENVRLRQAVVELSLDNMALREALKKNSGH